jgi:Fe-S-cluster containining protein
LTTNPKDYPCISCHTNCCKEYTIFVNAHDIFRLSKELRVDPEDFLEVYGAKDFDLGIKVEEGLIDLVLKQKNNTCIFLVEHENFFRCTVNDFKPGVCKSYPFQIENSKLIQMSDKLCPVEWDTQEFEKMMRIFLRKDEDEWNFYNQLILEWNTKDGIKKPLSAFLKFILDRVAISKT